MVHLLNKKNNPLFSRKIHQGSRIFVRFSGKGDKVVKETAKKITQVPPETLGSTSASRAPMSSSVPTRPCAGVYTGTPQGAPHSYKYMPPAQGPNNFINKPAASSTQSTTSNSNGPTSVDNSSSSVNHPPQFGEPKFGDMIDQNNKVRPCVFVVAKFDNGTSAILARGFTSSQFTSKSRGTTVVNTSISSYKLSFLAFPGKQFLGREELITENKVQERTMKSDENPLVVRDAKELINVSRSEYNDALVKSPRVTSLLYKTYNVPEPNSSVLLKPIKYPNENT